MLANNDNSLSSTQCLADGLSAKKAKTCQNILQFSSPYLLDWDNIVKISKIILHIDKAEWGSFQQKFLFIISNIKRGYFTSYFKVIYVYKLKQYTSTVSVDIQHWNLACPLLKANTAPNAHYIVWCASV